MHLDGDLAAVVELGAVAGGDASGSEIDVGQVAAESNVQVPAEPGIDVVAANGPEHRPLDPARQFVLHARAGPLRWVHSTPTTRPAMGGTA